MTVLHREDLAQQRQVKLTIQVEKDVWQKALMDAYQGVKTLFPVDGEVINACDKLAAFIEAAESIHNGITSKHLTEGIERLGDLFRNCQIGPIDFGAVFAQFRQLVAP